MKYKIKSNRQMNIIYHLISHLKIDHMACIYNEQYITDYDNFLKENNIKNSCKQLVNYSHIYQENFEHLLMLNFIPFNELSLEELMDTLRKYSKTLNKESKDFLEKFSSEILELHQIYDDWSDSFSANKEYIYRLEEYIADSNNPLDMVFNIIDADVDIFLVQSLFKFGRGTYIKDVIKIGVLEPTNDDEVYRSYLMILHELTHFLTNQLVDVEDEDLFLIKEKLAVVFDYIYIKSFYPKWLDKYIDMCNIWIKDVNQDDFLTSFKLDEKYINKIDEQITILENMKMDY